MSMKKTVVIVVPVYRAFVPSEAFAFAQALKVLGRYDISLLHPCRLDLRDVVASAPPNVTDKAMDDRWFRSIRSYNELCLSGDLYDAYSDYEYMLIYQLDAFVFRDALADWCARGYDYVGSPWLPNDNVYERTLGECVRWVKRTLCPPGTTEHVSHAQMHYHVGNGGFSLRRIPKMKAVVETYREAIDNFKPEERRSMEDIFFPCIYSDVPASASRRGARPSISLSSTVLSARCG